MGNQEFEVKPEIVNINRDKAVFFPFSIKRSKCSSSCNDINDPYARLCVPDVLKNINIRFFNLMSRTNETRYKDWHETVCKCKCRLDASVWNNKPRWDKDKCKCECKGLVDKIICDKGCIWSPSNNECECDKHSPTSW